MFILKPAYGFAQLPPQDLNKLDDLQNISVLFHSRHSTENRSEVTKYQKLNTSCLLQSNTDVFPLHASSVEKRINKKRYFEHLLF